MSSKKVIPFPHAPRTGALLLSDGSFYLGRSFGAKKTQTGEFVFHTGYTGYQEVLSDPSYCRQVIVFASPQIGNQGFHLDDMESRSIWAAGCVVRDYFDSRSHWRKKQSLEEVLVEKAVPGLSGVDTRSLVHRLRDRGCLWGVISTETADRKKLEKYLEEPLSMEGLGLTQEVSSPTSYRWFTGSSPLLLDHLKLQASTLKRCVVWDFGVKRQILRYLVDVGFEEVIVLPAKASWEDIQALSPDALVLSNGPGDPAADPRIISEVKKAIGKLPILGICLGHQILGLALGLKTYKMKFGQHAANHPIMNLTTRRVEITSQNHGFAVEMPSTDSSLLATHIHLNDGSLAGFVHRRYPICGIQFHPEASPGPLDSLQVFRQLKVGEFVRP